MRALGQGRSVLVAAPTGSGKTLIAEYALESCLSSGKRGIYTAPVKALSNQKFREFSGRWPGRVGIVTGDVSLHSDASILIMTTEIFRNALLEADGTEGSKGDFLDNVACLVMDEIHYLDDRERGTVWEECLILAPASIRVVCLSATVSNLGAMASWLCGIRPEDDLVVVEENERPVPLEAHVYVPTMGLTDIGRVGRHLIRFTKKKKFWEARLILDLEEADRLPALFFCLSRRDVEFLASGKRMPDMGRGVARNLLEEYGRLCEQFSVRESPQMRGALARGMAYHHAGLLPAEKEVVERLFSTGLVRVLFATETFAMGVHMPAKTVVFRSLFKMDRLLKVREFQQMAGRAGRRGLDVRGFVVLPPEGIYLHRDVLENLVEGEPEPIQSRFRLSYGTILHLYETLGERLFAIIESSFSQFDGSTKKDLAWVERELRQKLRLLESMGYVSGTELTDKGRFASSLYGFELPVAEAYWQGQLRNLSVEETALALNAISYEGDDEGTRLHVPGGMPFRREFRAVWQIVEDLRRVENSLRIFPPTHRVCFDLGPALYAWMTTGDFGQAVARAPRDPGDLVRSFRLTVQMLRDLEAACREAPLRARIRTAIERISRGVVDARAELLAGMEEEAAGAGLSP